MKIKRNIAFKLRPYGKDGNLFQIRMRVTFNGRRFDTKTGCQINNPSAWNDHLQLVAEGYVGPKGETAQAINNELRNVRDQMDTAFKFFEATDKNPTIEELKVKYEQRLNGTVPSIPAEEKKEGKPKAPGFFEVFDKFTAECGEKNAWTEATFQKWAALRNDLHKFRPGIKFTELNEDVLTAFVTYLRDTKSLRTPRKKKGDRKEYDPEDVTGLKNSTIEKKIDYLKWFLNWASEKGFNTNRSYKSFHPTLKKTQKRVIYLTKEEIKQIRSLELTADKAFLDPVRDVLLFCCFSGLRHSDANNLRRSDIKGDHIEITTVKTADSISVELNDITKAILEKYKKVPFKDNKALPNLTNQAMNRDVKKLCKLAGIDEEIRVTTYKGNVRTDTIYPKYQLIGTHTGRRTFIVNALSLGIPPDVVMKWTGHSDYKSMKPYIDIVDSIKAQSMAKFNDLL